MSGCQRKTKSKTEAQNLVCNHFSKEIKKKFIAFGRDFVALCKECYIE